MLFVAIGSFLQITRADTCILVLLSVFVPVHYATQDFIQALNYSGTLLPICMCGFVLNDLHDIDKDATNHPERPLPSKRISLTWASFVYFSLLTVSLVMVKALIRIEHAYLYLTFLLVLINYNYVVSYFPKLKNLYVAVAGLIPMLIVAGLVSSERVYPVVILSLFCFLLGREMLMDILDQKGDPQTFVKSIGINPAENIAFMLKAGGTLLIVTQVRRLPDIIPIIILMTSDAVFVLLWKLGRRRNLIINLMKVQLLIGIYFLL
jgi:geranylgeranylglycerol-phosphate geranylgeranyltransferase